MADGNDDGVGDPFNYYDGALATAVKTCRDGHGLASEAAQRRAALAYNGAAGTPTACCPRRPSTGRGWRPWAWATPTRRPGRSIALPDGPVTIVDVYGIQVNAAIAERVRALIDAARADGLELAEGSGGWRSPEGQIRLRRAHCGTSDYAIYQMPPSQCSPPTAPPGHVRARAGPGHRLPLQRRAHRPALAVQPLRRVAAGACRRLRPLQPAERSMALVDVGTLRRRVVRRRRPWWRW